MLRPHHFLPKNNKKKQGAAGSCRTTRRPRTSSTRRRPAGCARCCRTRGCCSRSATRSSPCAAGLYIVPWFIYNTMVYIYYHGLYIVPKAETAEPRPDPRRVQLVRCPLFLGASREHADGERRGAVRRAEGFLTRDAPHPGTVPDPRPPTPRPVSSRSARAENASKNRFSHVARPRLSPAARSNGSEWASEFDSWVLDGLVAHAQCAGHN